MPSETQKGSALSVSLSLAAFGPRFCALYSARWTSFRSESTDQEDPSSSVVFSGTGCGTTTQDTYCSRCWCCWCGKAILWASAVAVFRVRFSALYSARCAVSRSESIDQDDPSSSVVGILGERGGVEARPGSQAMQVGPPGLPQFLSGL